MRTAQLLLLVLILTLSACARPATPFDRQDPSALPIERAYNALMDHYIDPPDSAQLLQAAYQGVVQTLTDAGIQDTQTQPPTWDQSRTANFDRFMKAYEQINATYGSKVGSDKLEYAAIERMASSLKDCETNFFDPSSYKDRQTQLAGQQQFGGVGIIIKNIPGHPTILQVLDGPGQKAGLKAGDEIISVDGRATAGETFEEVRSRVRGPEGSKVELTVRRLGVAGPLTFDITREKVQAPVIEAGIIGGTAGYIHLYSFPPMVLGEIDKALQVFDERSVSSVILDLRANTGGDQQTIIAAASRFIKGGPVEIQVERSGKRTAFDADAAVYWKHPKPLVVLADDDTVAGGEIFARAIQEAGVGPVIGTPTSGCTATGRMFELGDGSALSISTAKVLAGNGSEINHVGVIPNLRVNYPVSDLATDNDPQLLAALNALKGRGMPGAAAGPVPSQPPGAGPSSGVSNIVKPLGRSTNGGPPAILK